MPAPSPAVLCPPSTRSVGALPTIMTPPPTTSNITALLLLPIASEARSGRLLVLSPPPGGLGPTSGRERVYWTATCCGRGRPAYTPPLFLPSVFVDWSGTSDRPVATTTTPPTSRRTINEFWPGPGMPGCTPAVQVCLVVLSFGTYPPFWPLALTCSRPLLGLEIR